MDVEGLQLLCSHSQEDTRPACVAHLVQLLYTGGRKESRHVSEAICTRHDSEGACRRHDSEAACTMHDSEAACTRHDIEAAGSVHNLQLA
eukprot:scaffold88194_cov17-Tisochrysis_lutea.AAC.1